MNRDVMGIEIEEVTVIGPQEIISLVKNKIKETLRSAGEVKLGIK